MNTDAGGGAWDRISAFGNVLQSDGSRRRRDLGPKIRHKSGIIHNSAKDNY